MLRKITKRYVTRKKLGMLDTYQSVMPEGEKLWGGGAVVIGGDNLPSPGRNRVK